MPEWNGKLDSIMMLFMLFMHGSGMCADSMLRSLKMQFF